MKSVMFLVPAIEDQALNKIAIVKAEIRDDSPLEPVWKFQEALSNSLKEWVNTTADGKKFFEKSSGKVDLNVLIPEQPFSHLFKMILAKYGIWNLTISILENKESIWWDMEDSLVDWNTA